MSTDELYRTMCDKFGVDNRPWPHTMVVDKETLKNVLYSIYQWKVSRASSNHIRFTIGPNGGPYFKSVELIVE